jgi:hypothetical protein
MHEHHEDHRRVGGVLVRESTAQGKILRRPTDPLSIEESLHAQFAKFWKNASRAQKSYDDQQADIHEIGLCVYNGTERHRVVRGHDAAPQHRRGRNATMNRKT